MQKRSLNPVARSSNEKLSSRAPFTRNVNTKHQARDFAISKRTKCAFNKGPVKRMICGKEEGPEIRLNRLHQRLTSEKKPPSMVPREGVSATSHIPLEKEMNEPSLRQGTYEQPGHVRDPPPVEESPAKKQSKWTSEEDNLTIELRGQGMKWEDISKRLPGRSAISCRLRYQNYLDKLAVWDEEKKNKLARLYGRFKDQMWQKVATEMGIPWRSAESMHWQLGEQEMAARANAPIFQLHPIATTGTR